MKMNHNTSHVIERDSPQNNPSQNNHKIITK
jgi:hypothetical protein